jgi:CRP-like cAMP-binding protein
MQSNLTAAEAAEVLKNVPFFSTLSGHEIAEVAERLVPRRFNPGQIIFHLGDPAGLLYVITSGKVKISHTTPEGNEALLAILGDGDFFGELALLDETPRSATAEALDITDTLTLHRSEFMHFIESNPAFARHVLYVLARRIRNMNSQISDIFFLDLSGRVARMLLNLATQYGVEVADGIQIDIPLTQTDLSEMTGATRVSINKTLGRFRRSGWLRVKGRTFTILNRPALMEMIQLSTHEPS